MGILATQCPHCGEMTTRDWNTCNRCGKALGITLRAWAEEAQRVIAHGAELMPIEQLRHWSGVRATLETYPDQDIAPDDECNELRTRIAQAVQLVEQYGGNAGEHYKQWLIDQMLLVLLGADYPAWLVERGPVHEAHPAPPEQQSLLPIINIIGSKD